MESNDGKNLFVIEAMVGEIDESHIVRCILYWLNEKKEVSMKNIHPIIIAENYNNRFFDVLYYLSNYIPFIVLQVTALSNGDLDSQGKRIVELVFHDIPSKGDSIFRARKKAEPSVESNREYWMNKMDNDQQNFLFFLESEINNLSGDLLVNFNKDNISIGLEGVSKIFLSITIRKNNIILEGFLPFHVDSIAGERKYNFDDAEFSVFAGKYNMKINSSSTVTKEETFIQLLRDSFEEYWREFGSPII